MSFLFSIFDWPDRSVTMFSFIYVSRVFPHECKILILVHLFKRERQMAIYPSLLILCFLICNAISCCPVTGLGSSCWVEHPTKGKVIVLKSRYLCLKVSLSFPTHSNNFNLNAFFCVQSAAVLNDSCCCNGSLRTDKT